MGKDGWLGSFILAAINENRYGFPALFECSFGLNAETFASLWKHRSVMSHLCQLRQKAYFLVPYYRWYRGGVDERLIGMK